MTPEEKRVLRMLWFHDGPLSLAFMQTTADVMEGLKARGLAHLGPNERWHRTHAGMKAISAENTRALRQFAKKVK